jgi:hypothetical protein
MLLRSFGLRWQGGRRDTAFARTETIRAGATSAGSKAAWCFTSRRSPKRAARSDHLQPSASGHSFFGTAIRVVIPGLTPGVVYTLQGQAVGGSTGFSDWSDPVSHMCT